MDVEQLGTGKEKSGYGFFVREVWSSGRSVVTKQFYGIAHLILQARFKYKPSEIQTSGSQYIEM